MTLVRLLSWVTKAQKAKVRKIANEAKKRDPKSSESSIIRRAIDQL
jgi:hypothetical protein